MNKSYLVSTIGESNGDYFTIELTDNELKTVLKFINTLNAESKDDYYAPKINIYSKWEKKVYNNDSWSYEPIESSLLNKSIN